jgi:hypothetical protein
MRRQCIESWAWTTNIAGSIRHEWVVLVDCNRGIRVYDVNGRAKIAVGTPKSSSSPFARRSSKYLSLQVQSDNGTIHF